MFTSLPGDATSEIRFRRAVLENHGVATNNNLLPARVPQRLGLISTISVLSILVGMIVAGAVGGVNWLIGVGSCGTALGTLGLAYFTFGVAERTTELAHSSQRLEAAANRELTQGRTQAQAAAVTATEAQKSRIDALAPILDFTLGWQEAKAVHVGTTSSGYVGLVRGSDHTTISRV